MGNVRLPTRHAGDASRCGRRGAKPRESDTPPSLPKCRFSSLQTSQTELSRRPLWNQRLKAPSVPIPDSSRRSRLEVKSAQDNVG